MRPPTRSAALLRKAHRQAVCLNPHPKYTIEWPDRRQAYKSQRKVGVNLIYCLRLMERVYLTSSLQTIIDRLPPYYNSLTSILATLQGIRLLTEEPRSKNNHKSKISTPNIAIWRDYKIQPLPRTFAKSRANEIPATAHAMESENLLNLVVVLKTLDTCADLTLDFSPSLIDPLQVLHANLSTLLLTLRSTWQLPKFTTHILQPTHHIPTPAKYIKHKQFSDEWRKAQRQKWHKTQASGAKP